MNHLRLSIGALGFVAVSACSAPAWGDSTTYITPSLSLGRAYDDNLFFTPTDPQSSALWRVSPGLEAGYLSEPLTLAGFFTVDAERYTQHPELDSNAVRRDETLNIGYKPTQRIDFAMDASYISTDTPAELAPGSSFGFGRARARVYTADPSLAYRLDPVLTGKVGYNYEKDELTGSFDTYARTGSLGLDYETSTRATWSADYAATDYSFTGTPITSRVLTVGLAYELGPETKATLAAGPRNTEGMTTAELSASLRHTFEDGSLRLSYARSQIIVFGLAKPVDTRSYQATLDFAPGPNFELLLIPSVVQDRSAGTTADVYRFGVNLSYKFTRSVAAVCTYQYNRQRGLLGGIGEVEITDRVIFLGVVFSYTGSFGGSFQARQSSPFETLWPAPRH